MLPDAVAAGLRLPIVPTREEGHALFDLVTANQLDTVLVVALRASSAAAYVAGALQQISPGRLTLVQSNAAGSRRFTVEELHGWVGCASVEQFEYTPGALGVVLKTLLTRYQHGHFSFCYLAGCRSWMESLSLLCVAEKLLRPGGWLGVHSIYHPSRGFGDQPGETSVSEVNDAYTLLVEGSLRFSSFRRAGGRGFASKLAELRSAQGHEVDLTISRALEIAYSDPEFRAALIRSPAATLSAISGEGPSAFAGISFCESGLCAPLNLTPGGPVDAPISIERPCWDWAADESFLKSLMREAGVVSTF